METIMRRAISTRIFSSNKWLLSCTFLAVLSACATPQGVKDASKNQLKLLDAMNTAAIALQQGLDDFHSQQKGTIEDWARVQVATDAIEVATKSESNKLTADSLFEADRSTIRPLIYGVTRNFAAETHQFSDLQNKAEGQIATAKDDETRHSLQLIADGLHLSKDRVTLERADWTRALNASGCAERCSTVHSLAVGLLTDETNTAAQIDSDIEILQTQIAIMSQIAHAIDQWLSIDVTLSQAQASQLDTTYESAISTLGKNK
jgi:hypothetical protein